MVGSIQAELVVNGNDVAYPEVELLQFVKVIPGARAEVDTDVELVLF
jgi:hypothetical protein